MPILELVRTLGALAVVLGLLVGGLWIVKRYNIALPGRVGGHSDRRLELVERLSVDTKRSAVLLRRDGHEHLIILAPEGNMLVESLEAQARQEQTAAASDDVVVTLPPLSGRSKTEPVATPDFPGLVEKGLRTREPSDHLRAVQGLRNFARRAWARRNLGRSAFAEMPSTGTRG